MENTDFIFLEKTSKIQDELGILGDVTVKKFLKSPTDTVIFSVDVFHEHIDVELTKTDTEPYFDYKVTGSQKMYLYANAKKLLNKYFTDRYPNITIGTDESGKGDFFGPLVVAGVALDKQGEKDLLEEGVKDSKQLSDAQVIKLSPIICRVAKRVAFAMLTPYEYNTRYEEVGNLNTLLGYGHLDVIRDITQEIPFCKTIVVDQFVKDTVPLRTSIIKSCNVQDIRFLPKAESKYIAVAAASIIARREFLRYMESMSEVLNYDVPKGCGSNVLEAAKAIAWEKGIDVIDNYVKKHFVTYKKVEESLK